MWSASLVPSLAVNFVIRVLAGYAILYIVGFWSALLYIVLFSCGIIVTLGALFYYLFVFNVPKPYEQRHRSRFRFVDTLQWKLQEEALRSDQEKLGVPIIKESFFISETLDEFISLIIQEFVDTWFSRITDNKLFQESIALELKAVFIQLKDRLAVVDFAKFLVFKILPIINEHVTEYLHASEKVHSQLKSVPAKAVVETVDHDIEVARNYKRGKIHSAVTVTKSGQNGTNEKAHLRQSIDSILPYLLSPKERNNEASMALVREILACTILCNIFDMMSEGDFYNMMIVKLIGENLQRRDQVKRLRAALDEHTQQMHDDKNLNKRFIITDTMDIAAYQDCLSSIEQCNQFGELKQLRVYISFQLLQASKARDPKLLETRLRQAQTIVEEKIKQLENVKVESIDLEETLGNTHCIGEFKKFMEKEDKLDLLNFWISVEELKSPAEFMNDKLSLSLGFSNYDSIKAIYDVYMKSANAFDLDTVELNTIEKFMNCKDLIEKSDLYREVTRILFRVQEKVMQQMDETYFREFMKTPEYQNLIDRKTMMANNLGKSKGTKNQDFVIKAVEDAFTQIMKTQTFYDEKALSLEDYNITPNNNSEISVSDSGSSNNRFSQIFEDSSDEYETDSDSVNLEHAKLQNSLELDDALMLAAPGNLKLTEEIDKLDEEIERLGEQQRILEPLIQKAEVQNNVGQLKILKNSFASLDREINAKELQKQQYIVQENDNSLFGKSRVTIQSYISGSDQTKDYILYIIEVQKFSNENPNITTAGWIVARRFSQFYKLHEYLRARYDVVDTLKFPKRTVLKFQIRQVVEMRKKQLEEYLQLLLAIQQVCSDRVFRSFLSSEEFTIGKAEAKRSNVEGVANKFYNGFSNSILSKPKTRLNETSTQITEDTTQNLKDMERELKSYDEREVFVKPIVDTLMTVFKLKTSKGWLRGRALLVILQQIFGTTLEKKIYEAVDSLKTEEKILDYLLLIKNVVFPNGKFKDPPIVRSVYERTLTKNESRTVLSIFMNDTFSAIFGSKNTKYGCQLLFNALQNDFLNKHLVFEIFDEIIKEVFPETVAA